MSGSLTLIFQVMTWGSVAFAAPEPVPVATPRPLPSASPLDVSGLWIGSTTTSQAFRLLVVRQVHRTCEGTVDWQRGDAFASPGVHRSDRGQRARTD